MAILMTAAITPAIAYDPKSCGCGSEDGRGVDIGNAETPPRITRSGEGQSYEQSFRKRRG